MNRLHLMAMLLFAALPLMAERVAPETAQKAAQIFLNNNGAKSAKLTDLSKTAGFANLYIFNAEQGFVVMAADDCVQPILGYSLTGHFVAKNMPENISGWLQGYSDEIQFAIDSKAKPSAETAKLWKDLIDGDSKAAKATIVVDNLLSTTWDQTYPYNALCPRGPSTDQLTVTASVSFEFVVNDLNATTDGNDIALSWTPLANDPQSATLKYVECAAPAYLTTYESLGVRFPASMLADYEGLALTSVGNWCTYGGDYSVDVYQCTTLTPTGTPIKTLSFSFPVGTTVG